MTRRFLLIAFLTVLVLFRVSPLHARPRQSGECPHKDAKPHHSDHEAMTSRGEQGMGFSQTTTAHHFLLKADGGIIAVTANQKKDAVPREQIREHLAHIADAFAQGDFDIPMFVHDQTPPGVPTMKRLSKKIRYQFRETDKGGQVEISSTDNEAIQAIHDFLLFQIREHKTGDPTSLP